MTKTKKHLNSWQPESWRQYPALQQPQYDNADELAAVLQQISNSPPLVAPTEIKGLKHELAQAAQGRRFILQGGDCAEKFADCTEPRIAERMKILLQTAAIFGQTLEKPMTTLGRMAGQFAKPRSRPTEMHYGSPIPVYRGDNVHSIKETVAERRPNPSRLLAGYQLSLHSMNIIRAAAAQSFFTSHEGLLLPLEEATTRFDPESGSYYNLSTHFLWLGDRTCQLGGAHVEYLRGIDNPIGIKIGPDADPAEIRNIVKLFNPANESGKVVLIPRLGQNKVQIQLPELIKAMQASNLNVCWLCDPMHGNTFFVGPQKTRDFNTILQELQTSFTIHLQLKSVLAGVHLEMTGDAVTECLGGLEQITGEDLNKNYQSYCDPRLNGRQSLELAFLASSMMREPARFKPQQWMEHWA